MVQGREGYVKRLGKELVKNGLAVAEKINWGVGQQDTKSQVVKAAKKILDEDS